MMAESTTNAELYRRAKTLIPGGTQLLSKRPELYAPEVWPAYYREASGCEIVDLDGRQLLDMSTNGIGSCLLGYADPDVTAAVIQRIQRGSMCSLNSPDEVELAELLVALHPWSEQVRYARSGGEAMAVAVRIARAKSQRDLVAFCGYHGWHDWYLAANLHGEDPLSAHLLSGLAANGVPRGLQGTSRPFGYNQLDELNQIVRQVGSQLAAVVLEPTRAVEPEPGFLEGVRQLCDESGAVMICDEISMGWRLHLGGAHLRYGISPDMAVFAKSISNGHPMAAVLGTAQVMQAAQSTFVSSTYWTESVGPAAALATIRKMQQIDVPGHVRDIGERAAQRWNALGLKHGIPVTSSGHPALIHLSFADEAKTMLETLFTVKMLDHGVLATSGFYPTLAHSQSHLERWHTAADSVFEEIAHARRQGELSRLLSTPVRQLGFQRLA